MSMLKYLIALVLGLLIGSVCSADVVYEQRCENGVCRMVAVEVPPMKAFTGTSFASASSSTAYEMPESATYFFARSRPRPLLTLLANRPRPLLNLLEIRPFRRFLIRMLSR